MNHAELQGQVAIVTGGASGIGAATVKQLLDIGARVAVFDRAIQLQEMAAAQTLANALDASGENVFAVAIDLADADAIAPAVDAVLARWGRIDILVNNAGITGPRASLLEFDPAVWDAVFAVDVKAPFLLIQQVGRHMVARGGGGRIVNVSSSSAYRALMSEPAYGSAKAALSQLTRVAAAQLGPHDINVNTVAPGVTATPLVVQALGENFEEHARSGPLSNLLQRVSQPEDVAAVIVFLCTKASRQMTAQVLHVSAGSIV